MEDQITSLSKDINECQRGLELVQNERREGVNVGGHQRGIARISLTRPLKTKLVLLSNVT